MIAFRWNQTPARGRGGRGGTRGAPGGRGGRGRGAVRGRGAIANKVQSGRVEKSSQAKKKSLLPPLVFLLLFYTLAVRSVN